jgi:hypothetical protein
MSRRPRFDGGIGEWSFDKPARGVWPDGVWERTQWMCRREKMPWAPWSDENDPAPCSKHGVPASECECNAKWKWGWTEHYRDGETARDAAMWAAEVDGICFLQQADGPFIFIDGDDVRDPDTGHVHPAFKAILAQFGATYTDISTSGTGVHAMYRGDTPDGVTEPVLTVDDEPWGANDDLPEIEIYATRHVCVTTGRHVPGSPTGVRELDGEVLDAVLDAAGELPDPDAGTGQDAGPTLSFDADAGSDSVDTPDTTTDMQDVYDALDTLDAREVADATIVAEWTSGGDLRSFLPTWGSSNDGGTANVVGPDAWRDTGRLGGRGGPVVMAAIKLRYVRPRNAEPGCVSGDEWARCVEHLRSLGFNIPELRDSGDVVNSDAYHAVVDDHAPAGRDPHIEAEAMLVGCLRAEDAGDVPEDARPPKEAFEPVAGKLFDAAVEELTDSEWSVVEDAYESLTPRKAREQVLQTNEVTH